jgi:mannosyl-oligosaccharide alpha-1,2-mannosidase
MLYITDVGRQMVSGRFEHLSCFFPALLSLGVWSLPDLTPQEQELHRMAAHGLAESCWVVYKDMESGLGAESVLFDPFLPRDINAGLFIKHYDKWIGKGRPAKGPLGLDRLATPISPKLHGRKYRDYALQLPYYRLRPEVRLVNLLRYLLNDR